jgi:hypothetical protein
MHRVQKQIILLSLLTLVRCKLGKQISQQIVVGQQFSAGPECTGCRGQSQICRLTCVQASIIFDKVAEPRILVACHKL